MRLNRLYRKRRRISRSAYLGPVLCSNEKRVCCDVMTYALRSFSGADHCVSYRVVPPRFRAQPVGCPCRPADANFFAGGPVRAVTTISRFSPSQNTTVNAAGCVRARSLLVCTRTIIRNISACLLCRRRRRVRDTLRFTNWPGPVSCRALHGGGFTRKPTLTGAV